MLREPGMETRAREGTKSKADHTTGRLAFSREPAPREAHVFTSASGEPHSLPSEGQGAWTDRPTSGSSGEMRCYRLRKETNATGAKPADPAALGDGTEVREQRLLILPETNKPKRASPGASESLGYSLFPLSSPMGWVFPHLCLGGSPLPGSLSRAETNTDAVSSTVGP